MYDRGVRGDDTQPADGDAATGKSFEDVGIETRRLQAALESRMFGRASLPVRAGRFEIVRRLGEGAMGAVYLARDPELDREVALKILKKGPGAHADADATTRLRREAQALAALNHPNVVEVLDVGVEDGQVFVAMEYVRGRTLAQWCEDHPLRGSDRFDRLLELAREAAAGLAAVVADTLKLASPQGEIIQTQPREGLWRALTPQVFHLQTLINALEKVITEEREVTDEAQAVEDQGLRPQLGAGSADNMKITRPGDLELAEMIWLHQRD